MQCKTNRTLVHERLSDENIRLVPLRRDHLAVGTALQREYDRLNVFDAVHLGVASVLDDPIVSTDTLYPDIEEIEHVDPRELE